jgi:rod shape-determining protein MreC
LKPVIDILATFKEYLVLSLCIVLSAGLLTLNDNPQIRSIRSIAVVAIGAAENLFGFIPNYFSLKKENATLRERNVALANEVSLLRESRLESIRLRTMLGLKQQEASAYIAANVVGKSQQPLRTTITLDVGEAEGVKHNMPIVTDEGLVGKTVFTGNTYTICQILLHKDFRVSARLQRSRADGILFWDGETVQMKNVPRTQDVKIGDLIQTSSYSTIYPEGIRIGLVSFVKVEPGALFHTIRVEPSVNFAALEQVFVLTRTPDSARAALEQTLAR